MRRVLGLDMSLTRSGIALGSAGVIERCTHAATAPPGGAATAFQGVREARIDFIVREVMCVFDSAPPDLVVIEDYAHGRATSSSTLGELGGVLRHELWLRDAPYVLVVSSTVKKHATGDGRASKDDMVAAALPWWSVDNDDEADALHMVRWGSEHYDELVEDVPL